jgi:hypothetical protein
MRVMRVGIGIEIESDESSVVSVGSSVSSSVMSV